jgi:hypothetical protein
MSNSAGFFVPATRSGVRVCLSSSHPPFASASAGEPAVVWRTPAIPFHPDRGVDGAPTGHSFCFVARARRDLRALRRGLSRSERDLSRRSTVAIFDRGPMPPPPGVKDRSRQRFVRAEPQSLPDGIPDLPRCGSRHNRGTPLLAPSLGSSPEDAPHERGCKSYGPNALRSQYQIQNIVGRKRAAEGRYHRVTVAS